MDFKKHLAIILFLFAAVAVAQQPVVKWSPSPLAISPFSPKSGDIITFKAVLRATGGDARDVTVVVGMDGKNLFLKTFPHIKSLETQNVEFEWTATAGKHNVFFYMDPEHAKGNYTAEQKKKERTFIVMSGPKLTATQTKVQAVPQKVEADAWKPVQPARIDPKHVVKLQDEPGQLTPLTNPQAEYQPPGQPQCDTPALPDIIISKISLDGPTWHPGETCEVRVYVKNIGQCDTGPILVHLEVREQSGSFDQRQEIGMKTSAPAPSNFGSPYSSVTVTFNYTVTDFGNSAAHYTFTATADPENFYQEFLENNNDKILEEVIQAH